MKKEVSDPRLEWESRPGESIEHELARLKAESSQIRKAIDAKKPVYEDWCKKVAEAKTQRSEAEELSRTFLRAYEKASYDHAAAMGQLRSSDMYFRFLTQDTEQTSKLEVGTLERSCALMDKTMDLLKSHIRMLHEVANTSASEIENAPGQPSPGLSPSPGLTPRTPGPSPALARLRALKVPPASPSLRG